VHVGNATALVVLHRDTRRRVTGVGGTTDYGHVLTGVTPGATVNGHGNLYALHAVVVASGVYEIQDRTVWGVRGYDYKGGGGTTRHTVSVY